MISWPLAAAKESGCFDRIIVSTDDHEIAQVAQSCGAEVPFLRPAELSDDYSGTIPVVAHAIRAVREGGEDPSEVCCIYATAAMLKASDLAEGLDLLQKTEARFAFSVTAFASPVQRALRMSANGRMAMLYPEFRETRSQDLEDAWHDAGQFYWGRAQAWLNAEPIFCEGSVPVVLPRHRVQDIDSPEDWLCAELMFEKEKVARASRSEC